MTSRGRWIWVSMNATVGSITSLTTVLAESSAKDTVGSTTSFTKESAKFLKKAMFERDERYELRLGSSVMNKDLPLCVWLLNLTIGLS